MRILNITTMSKQSFKKQWIVCDGKRDLQSVIKSDKKPGWMPRYPVLGIKHKPILPLARSGWLLFAKILNHSTWHRCTGTPCSCLCKRIHIRLLYIIRILAETEGGPYGSRHFPRDAGLWPFWGPSLKPQAALWELCPGGSWVAQAVVSWKAMSAVCRLPFRSHSWHV